MVIIDPMADAIAATAKAAKDTTDANTESEKAVAVQAATKAAKDTAAAKAVAVRADD